MTTHGPRSSSVGSLKLNLDSNSMKKHRSNQMSLPLRSVFLLLLYLDLVCAQCNTDQNPYCKGVAQFEQLCCPSPNVCYWSNRDGTPGCCPAGQQCAGLQQQPDTAYTPQYTTPYASYTTYFSVISTYSPVQTPTPVIVPVPVTSATAGVTIYTTPTVATQAQITTTAGFATVTTAAVVVVVTQTTDLGQGITQTVVGVYVTAVAGVGAGGGVNQNGAVGVGVCGWMGAGKGEVSLLALPVIVMLLTELGPLFV